MFRWLVDQRYHVPLKFNSHFPINTLMLMRAVTGVQMRQPYATHVVQNNPPQAVATLKQP